jgi:hypothetical protein
MSSMSKCLLVVNAILLLETSCHKTSLIALKRAIRASLDLVDPLACDGSDMRRQRNKVPSTGTLYGSNLLSHGMLPLLMSDNLLIGHGLSQNSSSETKATRRPKGAAVTKSIARRRLRKRSKDGR